MKTALSLLLVLALVAPATRAVEDAVDTSTPVVLRIDAARVTARVSPLLYGLMTEEINYSYDGGLYAELVRNRTFQDDAETPAHWTLRRDGEAEGSIALDRSGPLNAALPVSLRMEVTAIGRDGRVGVANDGFWGIPVVPNTTYRASLFAKAVDSTGPLTVSIESPDGATVFATGAIDAIGADWRKYTVSLRTGTVAETAAARLVVSMRAKGTVWLNLVSLFPPTWNNRPNGNRPDLMRLLADLKPRFLRFPGGNYLQGRTLATRFDWKRTLGDLSERPGHLNDAWNYRSSDGMGLLEFLLWCEDLNMEPVLGVFAGFTLRGVALKPGPELDPYISDALDEIEYVMGDATTKWGARRAKDGHPAPFKLTYVEVGNEDFFDREPGSYDARFTAFHDAIKKRYPQLKVIATMKVTGRVPDLLDDHNYKRQAEALESDAGHYDTTDRRGPGIFVGEWATRIGRPTTNLLAAISDAAWMTGLERNSDVVVMQAYAPLFVNVSDMTPKTGSMQWECNLIGYDALHAYGSPSYHAQVMFSGNHGDVVLASTSENNPVRQWQPPRGRGAKPEAPAPATRPVPAVFHVATRDTSTGTIYLKLVNSVAVPHRVRVDLAGVQNVAPEGSAIILTSPKPDDTNTIAEPTKVVPVKTRITGVGRSFFRELPPFSVTVLVLETR